MFLHRLVCTVCSVFVDKGTSGTDRLVDQGQTPATRRPRSILTSWFLLPIRDAYTGFSTYWGGGGGLSFQSTSQPMNDAASSGVLCVCVWCVFEARRFNKSSQVSQGGAVSVVFLRPVTRSIGVGSIRRESRRPDCASCLFCAASQGSSSTPLHPTRSLVPRGSHDVPRCSPR